MSADEFYIIGCGITKHALDESRAIGERRFRSFFGCSVKTCSKLWDMLNAWHPPRCEYIFIICVTISEALWNGAST
jgi:hypothetical protein